MTTLEVCERAGLDDSARKLAEREIPVRVFIDELARGGRVREAVHSLVQVMPRTDAIAWGAEAIRKVDVALLHRGGPEAMQHIEASPRIPSPSRPSMPRSPTKRPRRRGPRDRQPMSSPCPVGTTKWTWRSSRARSPRHSICGHCRGMDRHRPFSTGTPPDLRLASRRRPRPRCR